MAVYARAFHCDGLRWHGGRASTLQLRNSWVSLRSHPEAPSSLGPSGECQPETSSGTNVDSGEKTSLLQHTLCLGSADIVCHPWNAPLHPQFHVVRGGYLSLPAWPQGPSWGMTKDKQPFIAEMLTNAQKPGRRLPSALKPRLQPESCNQWYHLLQLIPSARKCPFPRSPWLLGAITSFQVLGSSQYKISSSLSNLFFLLWSCILPALVSVYFLSHLPSFLLHSHLFLVLVFWLKKNWYRALKKKKNQRLSYKGNVCTGLKSSNSHRVKS